MEQKIAEVQDSVSKAKVLVLISFCLFVASGMKKTTTSHDLNEFENQTCTLLSLQQKIESESKGLNLRLEA